ATRNLLKTKGQHDSQPILNWCNQVDLVILGVLVTLIEFQRNLNWVLLILRALILWSRVDGGTPSLAAAPDGPPTRPLVSASAASIISCSLRVSTSPLGDADAVTRDIGGGVFFGRQKYSTPKNF